MTFDEIFNKQSVWTAFFNKPLTKNDVDEILEGIEYHSIEYIGTESTTHKETATWHTVTFRERKEINKLRTILLMDNMHVDPRVAESGTVYLDVYREEQR